jgi:hypothetical protein
MTSDTARAFIANQLALMNKPSLTYSPVQLEYTPAPLVMVNDVALEYTSQPLLMTPMLGAKGAS